MENKLKIPKNTVVYCSTYDLTRQVLTLVNSLGYYWCNHKSYLDESIHLYLSNVYYDFHSGQYSYEHYDHYKVITDIEFLNLHNMEERTVKITLNKAKEFYKQGGSNKELALLAFTEEELNDELLIPDNITIYNDNDPFSTILGIGFNNKQVLMYDKEEEVFGIYASSCFGKIKCKLILCKIGDLKIGDIFVSNPTSIKCGSHVNLVEYYKIYLEKEHVCVQDKDIKVIDNDKLKFYYLYYKVVPING